MRQTLLAIIMFQALLALPLPAEERSPEDQELIKQLDISNVDTMHGLTFEIYICKLLENQGYKAKNMPRSNDFGTDIIATKGDAKVSIQVKRSKNPIDRKTISDAVAGMKYYKCNRSMAVSNNVFTKQAKKFAKETGCVLIGREELIKWITAYRQTAKNKND